MILTNGSYVWMPHLILQRGLGVHNLNDVNFKVTLPQPARKPVKLWAPKEDKPKLMTQIQGLTGPNRRGNEHLIDNNRGQFFDKGTRPDYLISEEVIDGQIVPVYERGEPIYFKYKGYATFLFQEEYDLIKEVLLKIQEITIHTTNGLSPLFTVLAVLKEDEISVPSIIPPIITPILPPIKPHVTGGD